ncbi:hypothetical protein DXG03_005104, partial [Asterophora parasitica]
MDEEIAALQARRQVHAEHVIERFRIAVAPFKRLPVELLANIFSYFIPHRTDDEGFYDGGRAPWILGQVCAHWRQVSRSDTTLWSVYIQDESVHSKRLCELLPPVANTRAVFNVNVDSLRASTIIPILQHITHLDLTMDVIRLDMLWRKCSPESFIGLESLELAICENTARSMDNSESLYDASRWAEYTPFRLAHNLQSLSIECDDDGLRIGPIVCAMESPRDNIWFLNLSDTPGLSATMVAEYIKKCTALETLYIKLAANADASDQCPSMFDTLHHLQSLTLESAERADGVD